MAHTLSVDELRARMHTAAPASGDGQHRPQSYMDERSARLLTLGSAHLCDALRACGRHFQAVDGGIRPVAAGMRVAGPAFTIRCYPGATWAMEKSLELAAPGSVLAVDGAGAADVILMGGLMSTRAKSRGIAGAVLDAAVRDVEDIIALNFPVFSRYVCPRAGTFAEIGEWQTVICLGRVPIRPNDLIVADQNGVVVVPIELVDQVIEQASKIVHKEEALRKHLEAGRTFAEALALMNGQS